MNKILISLYAFFLSASTMMAGTYVEFSMKSKIGGKEDASIQGTLKAWYQDGNTRSQVQMDLPMGQNRLSGMPDMGNMAILTLRNQPDQTFMLDEKNKTYFEMPKAKDKENQEEEFEITIVGQEKINGYNSTHIKAIGKVSGAELDWWVSKDVAGYQDMKNFRTKQFNTGSMYKAMESKGVEGFPIRMVGGSGKEKGFELNLVKSEKMDIPATRFSLDGYTKKEGSPFMPGGMDPGKLKNMSPEERMKFIQEMQQKMKEMKSE